MGCVYPEAVESQSLGLRTRNPRGTSFTALPTPKGLYRRSLIDVTPSGY